MGADHILKTYVIQGRVILQARWIFTFLFLIQLKGGWYKLFFFFFFVAVFIVLFVFTRTVRLAHQFSLQVNPLVTLRMPGGFVFKSATQRTYLPNHAWDAFPSDAPSTGFSILLCKG